MTKEEKQKVINALRISAPVMAVTQEEFNDYIQTLNKIMDWLEQEPRWIPASKRLPEESKEYFVTVQHIGWNCKPTKFVSSSKYNPKTRCFECEDEKWRGDKVIAWMPTPEPYKEGE